MSKFSKKGKRATPAISTASLPDIVFMLLFFFMVTTVVKESDPKVIFEIPETEYTKLIKDRQSISFIYVGKSKNPSVDGEGIVFEINGTPVNSVSKLTAEISKKYNSLSPSEKAKFYFALKIDSDVEMFNVKKVKEALQNSDALRIIYSTVPVD